MYSYIWNKAMKLSVVSTLYQSSRYLDEFYSRVSISARSLVGDEYEIIFVNDGSPDNSLDMVVRYTRNDPHVKVIDLSRNFGHHKAIMTGLQYSRGELVFLIDCDLEEDPEWLSLFLNNYSNYKCDVVFGVQRKRKGAFFEQYTGYFFWWLFNKVSGLGLPENQVTARLMTRRYVDALLLHHEREIFLAGIWHITGFDQVACLIDKSSRRMSTYTFKRKVDLFINSITSFSNKPLVMIFYIGSLISLMSILFICILIFRWAFLYRPPTGWTSLIASLWLLGGMMISFTGVIGIYLAKIFIESKQRPYTIIRHIYGHS